MSILRYHKLFEVSITHAYYQNGVFNDLMVHSDAQTERMMQQYGLLLNVSRQGFEIHSSSRLAAKDLDYFIKQVAPCLAFDLYSSNQWYTNFTQIPLDKLTFFSFSSKLQRADGKQLTPDLKEEKSQSGKIGRVALYFESLISSKEVVPVKYQLHFEARSCRWQYCLINRNSSDSGAFTIKGADGRPFTGPETVTTPNGENALLYTSSADYLLQEYPTAYCMLLKDQASDKTNHVSGECLPTALPNSVRSGSGTKKGTAISSIYIYL